MKNFKKVIAIAIVAIMMLAVVPFSVSAAASDWDGNTATAFGGGTGTEADPYIIDSANQLSFLAKSTNEGTSYAGVYFKLTSDINLKDRAWTPIGVDKKTPFKGNFDGNNHFVTGLNAVVNTEWSGLFGYMTSGSIKNLNTMGSAVSAVSYAGGIVGYMNNGSSVINCTSEIDVIGHHADANGSFGAGGIVGRAELSGATRNLIVGCTNRSNVGSTSEGLLIVNTTTYIGGILGVGGDVDVVYCTNLGRVISPPAEKAIVLGGIVGCAGANLGSCSILWSVNAGEVIAYRSSGVKAVYVGGAVGRSGHVEGTCLVGAIVTGNAYAYENLTTNNDPSKVGALIGHARGATAAHNNYVTSEGIVSSNDIGLDEDAIATVVDASALKGVDVFQTVKTGETMASALKSYIRCIAYTHTIYDEKDFEKMAEYTNGVELFDYLAEEVLKTVTLDTTKVLWEADIFGETPYPVDLDAAIQLVTSVKDIVAPLKAALVALDEMSKPAETDPVETDPVETEPTETEPAETDPVETEPVETDPVETDPETTPVEQSGCKGAVVSGMAVLAMAAACAVVLKKKR